MIEYSDGSVLAQISATDMRMPIQYALTYPERCEAPVPQIDWSEARQWEFLPPDFAEVSAAETGLPVPGGGRVGHVHVERRGRDRRGSFSGKDESASRPFTKSCRRRCRRCRTRNLRTVGDILEIDRESRALARDLVAARAAERR